MTNLPTKPILKNLAGIPTDIAPLWLMRQAGRYLPEYQEIRKNVKSFLEMCYTPELAVEVTLQPIRRFGMDAAILFSDILVIPDALGQKVAFQAGEGPVLEKLTSLDDIKKLNTTRVIEKLAPVFQTIRTLSKELPKETTLIGFAGSPWTVATYMVEGGGSKDFSAVKELAYKEPEIFQQLIDALVEATSLYLIEQVKAGAEVVQLFDSWAGVLPEKAFARWVIEPTKKIVQNLRQVFPHIPVIGFPRGAGFYYQTYAEQTGVTALGLDTTVPVQWAAKNLQAKLPVQGNLDPVILLSNHQFITASVTEILEKFSGKPFIFNLGHGILPQTPVVNVYHLIETVRNWRSREAA